MTIYGRRIENGDMENARFNELTDACVTRLLNLFVFMVFAVYDTACMAVRAIQAAWPHRSEYIQCFKAACRDAWRFRSEIMSACSDAES